MSGATKKNPQRFRDREAAPEPLGQLGEPPAHLSPATQAAWREIAAQMPPQILGDTDRIALEIMAGLLVNYRGGVLTKASEIQCLITMLARFGMTPADRNKIQAPKKQEPDADEWSPVIRRKSERLRDEGSAGQDSGVEVGSTRLQ